MNVYYAAFWANVNEKIQTGQLLKVQRRHTNSGFALSYTTELERVTVQVAHRGNFRKPLLAKILDALIGQWLSKDGCNVVCEPKQGQSFFGQPVQRFDGLHCGVFFVSGRALEQLTTLLI